MISRQEEDPSPHKPNNVAVVAVHGVGNPAPGETARAIAALLLRLGDQTPQTPYSFLKEEQVTFPGGELPKPSRGPKAPPRNRVKERLQLGWREQYPTDPTAFIHEQLDDFQPKDEDETYQTPRISTARCDGQKVDIYEVHWSDITRRGKGFLLIFIELYQLLFHLGLLSEKTILSYYFSLKKPGPCWMALRFLVFVASRYLTRVVVLYNLWLIPPALFAAVFYPLIASHLVPADGPLFLGGFGTIALFIALVASIFYVTKTGSTEMLLTLGITACLLMIAGGTLCYLAHGKMALCLHSESTDLVGAVAGYATLAAMGTGLTILFNKYHPNSEYLGVIVGGVISYAFAFCAYNFPHEHVMVENFFILATLGSMLNGIIVIVLLILIFVTGICALKDDIFDATKQGTRAFVTATLGLAVPAILITVLTVTAWECLDLASIHLSSSPPDSIPQGLLQLGTSGSLSMVAIFSVALILGIMIVLPTVLVEVAVPDLDFKSSRQLGLWLTAGGWFLNIIAIFLLVAAVSPIFGKGGQIHTLHLALTGGWKYSPNNDIFSYLTALLGGGGVLVMILKNFLEGSSGSVLSILERVLDVDEYLRDSPDGYTTKARIFNRYHALIKGLVTSPPNGVSYDKIIIIAHSQGAVISADYLRYIQDIGCEWQTPIALFTMGNPLRQLYAWRFPTWYDWAWQHPQSIKLGLVTWSNAFGAGDGVGRSLWQDPALSATYQVNLSKPVYWRRGILNGPWFHNAQGTQREACIGNTGHIHYWDTSNNLGSEVAVELDLLI